MYTGIRGKQLSYISKNRKQLGKKKKYKRIFCNNTVYLKQMMKKYQHYMITMIIMIKILKALKINKYMQ